MGSGLGGGQTKVKVEPQYQTLPPLMLTSLTRDHPRVLLSPNCCLSNPRGSDCPGAEMRFQPEQQEWSALSPEHHLPARMSMDGL